MGKYLLSSTSKALIIKKNIRTLDFIKKFSSSNTPKSDKASEKVGENIYCIYIYIANSYIPYNKRTLSNK